MSRTGMHAREQIPETCPGCGHKTIEVTEPYTPSKPGMMATDKQWVLVHADPSEGDGCDCDCLEASLASLHPVHKCLACGYSILQHEPEISIRVKPFGIRYRHKDDDGCRKAMSQDFGSQIVSGGLIRGKR